LVSAAFGLETLTGLPGLTFTVGWEGFALRLNLVGATIVYVGLGLLRFNPRLRKVAVIAAIVLAAAVFVGQVFTLAVSGPLQLPPKFLLWVSMLSTTWILVCVWIAVALTRKDALAYYVSRQTRWE